LTEAFCKLQNTDVEKTDASIPADTGSRDIRTNVGSVKHLGDGTVIHTNEQGHETRFASHEAYSAWVDRNLAMSGHATRVKQEVEEETTEKTQDTRRGRWGGVSLPPVAESSGVTVAAPTISE